MRNKRKSVTYEDSKVKLDKILNLLTELKMLSNGKVQAELNKCYEDLEYAPPSIEDNIVTLDTKIYNYLGDIKIYITTRQETQLEFRLSNLKEIIIERNSKT